METNDLLDAKALKKLLNEIDKNPSMESLHSTRRAVLLYDADDTKAPASMPVLRMACYDGKMFLSVCTETEEHGVVSYKIIVDMAFDANTFFNAVNNVLDERSEEILV